AIRIDRSELRLQKPPIDRARELHQCMRQINDPIQPGAEQILLPGLLSLPRPHRSPSLDHLEGKESQPPIRRNRKNNLQENRSAAAQFRQKPLLGKAQSPFSFNALEILHGRLDTNELRPDGSRTRGSRKLSPPAYGILTNAKSSCDYNTSQTNTSFNGTIPIFRAPGQ